MLGVKTRAAQTKQIRALTDDFRAAEQRTLGILCKTQKQANQLHRTLSKDDEAIDLLTASSAAFRQGVVICTAHTAKGLEFDQVSSCRMPTMRISPHRPTGICSTVPVPGLCIG